MYTRTCAVYRAWLDLLRMVESNTLCNKTKTFHSGEVFHCIFPLNFVVVIFYWSVWYLVASVPFVHFDFMLFTFNSYWQTSSSPDRIRMWSLSAATNKLFFPRESRNNTKSCEILPREFLKCSQKRAWFRWENDANIVYLSQQWMHSFTMTLQEIDWDKNSQEWCCYTGKRRCLRSWIFASRRIGLADCDLIWIRLP